MNKDYKKYIVLWLSQSVSGLGSSMTGYALVLLTGRLSVWNIYVVNAVVGITNAFQQPAAAVATGKLVPKDKISNVSGMNSFSQNLIVIFSPMLAAAFYAAGGLRVILMVDLATFDLAFCVLLFVITIPEQPERAAYTSPFSGAVEGLRFLKQERGLLYIMLTMALINFFSRLTMAVGRNVFWWSAAAVAASMPIPFIMANQNAILYRRIPEELQGMVFAVRNAIQYSTIPVGILLGGYLADYVFEPFLRSGTGVAVLLQHVVGNSAGSGMAAMFLCTGILGFSVSFLSCFNRQIRKLDA